MDFALSFLVAGVLSCLELFIAAIVYVARLRGAYSGVSKGTRRALIMFLIAGLAMGGLGIQGLVDYTLAPMWMTIMLGSLLIAQLSLILSSDKMYNGASALIGIAMLAVSAIMVYVYYNSLPREQPIVIAVLSLMMVASFLGGIYIVRASPSAFTGTMMALIVLIDVGWFAALLGTPTIYPQFFIIVYAPPIVTAAMLGSILRPWRRIASLSISLLAATMGVSLAIPAFMNGDTSIWVFGLVAAFAGACTVLPMDYFIDQATATRAKTPTYISLTLIFIALLAITHSNNFAIAFSSIGFWDPTILYIDWIFGVSGVSCFIMAAVSASFSNTVRNASRDLLLCFGSLLVTLGHPFVENGRYDLNPLYIPVLVLIVLGFMGFFKVTLQLYRAGSGKAGARFMAFMFASLAIGIVAMFADRIPLLLLVPIMVGAGLLLIGSSPRGFSFLRKR